MAVTTLQHTPLYERHVAAKARMVDFGGWEMPVHYGSQIEEHHAVRGDAGLFDVSHMTVVDLHGEGVRDFLRNLIANDVAKLKTPGRALYSCMLNERGGVIDDLIVYFMGDAFYRVIVNAATRDKDTAWIEQRAERFDVTVTERRDLAMLAVQGPRARERALGVLGAAGEPARSLLPFSAADCGAAFVARTGYTGEDGVEILLAEGEAPALWDALVAAGVRPCGLGARDTLRLEAGLHLYGADMTEDTTPLETGLTWTVAFEPAGRDFVGRAALEAQRAAGVTRKLAGLLLEGRGVLRAGQKVFGADGGEGVVTSGTFSPTLKRSIALAHLPATTGASCEVEIRGSRLPASVHKPPFVRGGEIKIEL